jgi:hypothetical protein
MKLFIPEIGTNLTLQSDWVFTLYKEQRNLTLFKKLNYEVQDRWNLRHLPEMCKVTIPKGTVLTISRVYIRNGNDGYSSVTFTISKTENKKHQLSGSRFWAKLIDVNEIDYFQQACNDDTYEYIKNLNNTIISLITSNRYKYYLKNVPKIVLGGSINAIRPQEDISTFVTSALDRLNNFKLKNKGLSENASDVFEKIEEVLRKDARNNKFKNIFAD